MTQGIRDFEPTRGDWLARLEALRTADGQTLAPCLRSELLRECRRLRQVMEMVAEVEAEQKAVAEAEDGNAARLARLRGIGTTSASPGAVVRSLVIDVRHACQGAAGDENVSRT